MRLVANTPGAEKYLVLLNGRRVSHVVEADDNEGKVVFLERDDNGKWTPKTVTGNVVIRASDIENSEKLRAIALRLKDLSNLTDEEDHMNPHDFPAIITETMGGPARKRHRPHQYEGPRGHAEAEDEDEESSTEEC